MADPIDRFEAEINRLLTYEDDGVHWREESLELYLKADGSLSCRFRDGLIPCEGLPWRDALGMIVEHIAKAVAVLPAGEWGVEE